jgi:hypothetical protein
MVTPRSDGTLSLLYGQNRSWGRPSPGPRLAGGAVNTRCAASTVAIPRRLPSDGRGPARHGRGAAHPDIRTVGPIPLERRGTSVPVLSPNRIIEDIDDAAMRLRTAALAAGRPHSKGELKRDITREGEPFSRSLAPFLLLLPDQQHGYRYPRS